MPTESAPTGLDTFPRLLAHHAQVRGAHPAIREKDLGIWQTWTWAEMAGEVRSTRLLLGMGLANLSMHPAHLLAVKQRVLTTDVAQARAQVERMRRNDDPVRLAAMLDRLNA